MLTHICADTYIDAHKHTHTHLYLDAHKPYTAVVLVCALLCTLVYLHRGHLTQNTY